MKKLLGGLWLTLFLGIGVAIGATYVEYVTPTGNFVTSTVIHTLNGAGKAVPVSSTNQIPVTPVTRVAASAAVAGTTSGTPNTFTSALASSTTRNGCLIQYTGAGVLSIFVGAPGSGLATTSFKLTPNSTFSCTSGQVVLTNEISVASATASDTYVVVAQ